ncbi:hypothetical protein SEEB0231_23255, partial [Salmonella enterica subsp. enterica serovar Bareilly str. CFSAN000231]
VAAASPLFGGGGGGGGSPDPKGRGARYRPGGKPNDQCKREQTADGPRKWDQVRVKGCGKSAPRGW